MLDGSSYPYWNQKGFSLLIFFFQFQCNKSYQRLVLPPTSWWSPNNRKWAVTISFSILNRTFASIKAQNVVWQLGLSMFKKFSVVAKVFGGSIFNRSWIENELEPKFLLLGVPRTSKKVGKIFSFVYFYRDWRWNEPRLRLKRSSKVRLGLYKVGLD